MGSDGHKPVSRSQPPTPLLGSNQVKEGQSDLIFECFAYRFLLFLVGYDQESMQSYKFLDSGEGGTNTKKAKLINAERESRSLLSSGLLDPALSEARGPRLLSYKSVNSLCCINQFKLSFQLFTTENILPASIHCTHR